MLSYLKNIATSIKKENLLLVDNSYFWPRLDKANNVARVFSKYFENNTLKNEKRKLVLKVTTAYNFYWNLRKYVNHICNSRKQVIVHKLLLYGIKVFEKLFLKVCNVSDTFSSVETSYRYFKSSLKQHWFTNNLWDIYQ